MIKILIEKWATPAGLLIVLGLVIWLVQLNQNAINNAEAIGALKASDTVMMRRLNEIGLSLQRTVALQEVMFNRADSLEDKFEHHEQLMYQNGSQ